MPISVASPSKSTALAAALRALVRTALAREKRTAAEISIVLTDDAALRELNRRWRKIDRATDVLSFPYGPEPPGPRVTGDLVVSLDRMRAQAKRYRTTEGRELARLVVHGALHLAGLDHHAVAERLHMRKREAEVLKASAAHVRALERALPPVDRARRGARQ